MAAVRVTIAGLVPAAPTVKLPAALIVTCWLTAVPPTLPTKRPELLAPTSSAQVPPEPKVPK